MGDRVASCLQPLVSIIVPTRNRADLLRVAMTSLFTKTHAAPAIKVLIIDHASDESESLDYFKSLAAQHKNVRVIRAEGPFNWSRLNNLGAREAKGNLLLFLNNDVEITEAGWLRELAAQRSGGQGCRVRWGARLPVSGWDDSTCRHRAGHGRADAGRMSSAP